MCWRGWYFQGTTASSRGGIRFLSESTVVGLENTKGLVDLFLPLQQRGEPVGMLERLANLRPDSVQTHAVVRQSSIGVIALTGHIGQRRFHGSQDEASRLGNLVLILGLAMQDRDHARPFRREAQLQLEAEAERPERANG